MRRIQCRVCLEFMDFTRGRTCSEHCEEIAKRRDAETVAIIQGFRLRNEEKSAERKRLKLESKNRQRLRRAEKKRKRRERAEALKAKVTVQAKQIRALKQGREPNGFYESRQWQELRYRAIRTYGRRCMCCGETKGQMHVDHIKPRSKFPNLALCFENLQILCRACNMGKSNIDDTDWRGITQQC